MKDLIIAAVLIVMLGLAAAYVIRAKKKGQKCIGCPNGSCGKGAECSDCACACGKED